MNTLARRLFKALFKPPVHLVFKACGRGRRLFTGRLIVGDRPVFVACSWGVVGVRALAGGRVDA